MRNTDFIPPAEDSPERLPAALHQLHGTLLEVRANQAGIGMAIEDVQESMAALGTEAAATAAACERTASSARELLATMQGQ